MLNNLKTLNIIMAVPKKKHLFQEKNEDLIQTFFSNIVEDKKSGEPSYHIT